MLKNTDPRLPASLFLRRLVFFGLVMASTVWGGRTINTILSPDDPSKLTVAIICLFTILFGWISSTFWTVLLGFVTLMRRNEPFAVPVPKPEAGPIDASARTAIIMPVHNEDVRRIFSGLQAMYESLSRTGQLERFDLFILSDSTKPEQHAAEEAAWAEICRRVNGEGRIFYRRRSMRLHKKSGNVSDFCRRWGANYKYLIPLDADSLVSGRLMVDLVRIMESRPDAGIVQTAPKGANQKSFISRIQQFTSNIYGPLHLAGSHFWQLNDAGFWGHNAIIRMEPFIKYCALPVLPGKPPFGGPILSHDFVEAALMRRAGWGVWLNYDLEESHEELPPDLLEELTRDNRWCKGNIQHFRLVFARGYTFGHRLLFLNGNMAYFSSLLWFTLLVLMTTHSFVDYFAKPQYFWEHRRLFPYWRVHYEGLSLHLLQVTLVFLFFPKVLSLVWMKFSGRDVKLFGGWARLIASVILETLFSVLLAPIKMLFHSWFVMCNLTGGKLEWNAQSRELKKVSWGRAIKSLGPASIGASLWGLLAFELDPVLFFWLSPIVVPLALSIPIVVFSSYPAVGEFFRKRRIFLAPVETSPPKELVRLNELVRP